MFTRSIQLVTLLSLPAVLVAHGSAAECPGKIHLTREEIQAYKPQDDPLVAPQIVDRGYQLRGYQGLVDAIKDLPDKQRLLIYLKVADGTDCLHRCERPGKNNCSSMRYFCGLAYAIVEKEKFSFIAELQRYLNRCRRNCLLELLLAKDFKDTVSSWNDEIRSISKDSQKLLGCNYPLDLVFAEINDWELFGSRIPYSFRDALLVGPLIETDRDKCRAESCFNVLFSATRLCLRPGKPKERPPQIGAFFDALEALSPSRMEREAAYLIDDWKAERKFGQAAQTSPVIEQLVKKVPLSVLFRLTRIKQTKGRKSECHSALRQQVAVIQGLKASKLGSKWLKECDQFDLRFDTSEFVGRNPYRRELVFYEIYLNDATRLYNQKIKKLIDRTKNGDYTQGFTKRTYQTRDFGRRNSPEDFGRRNSPVRSESEDRCPEYTCLIWEEGYDVLLYYYWPIFMSRWVGDASTISLLKRLDTLVTKRSLWFSDPQDNDACRSLSALIQETIGVIRDRLEARR